MKTITILFAFACVSVLQAQVWVSDKGNGTYKNPVIYADYSDPDVIRVGDDYYMTASGFNCVPGLQILHSKDLVNWKIVNYALSDLYLEGATPPDFFNKPQHGKGVWAPCIRYHKGEYLIYWGDPDFGIYVVKTKDILGKWDKPILVKAGKGLIDPSPLFDNDGKVYLVHAWAGSRAGLNSILTVCELNGDGTKAIGKETLVFDGNDGINHTVEGGKFYKKDGYYYILAPAGGVETGWQIALRSKNVYGPYEVKKVLAQGNTDINGPHQGGLVDTQTGESWFLHFQDKGAYGRIIHLQPVTWKDGWPVMGINDKNYCGEPVSTYRKPNVGKAYPIENPQESDEFNSNQLGLQWQWHANPGQSWGFPSANGYLRLYGQYYPENFTNFWDIPNLLLQKLPAPEFMATVKMTVTLLNDGDKTGLIMMGLDYAYIALTRKGNDYVLEQIVCQNAEQKMPEKKIAGTQPEQLNIEKRLNYQTPIDNVHFFMRLQVKDGGICTFSYSTDGKKFHLFGEPFKARQGKWIGAKMGMFILNKTPGTGRSWVDMDWFRIEQTFDAENQLDYCNRQIQKTLMEIQGKTGMPRNISDSSTTWNLVPVEIGDWTVGFWPGILWYNYENTKKTDDRNVAIHYTDLLQPLTGLPAYDHDMGFQFFCSYGNAYRLTGNEIYKQIILNAADTLATLFNPKVGTILSWPREVENRNWPHNTIMDNMINLEMLYWASKNGGNKKLYDIATQHAETTMKYHFREDGGCYHIAVYDTIDGHFIKGLTHQGYADSSLWARGQAWAIYGYTMVYRETQDKKFLRFAEKVTDLYLSRLPENEYVPFWDFDAPNIPNEPRDAAAATVVASALLELSQLEDNELKAKEYKEMATNMLIDLSSEKYQSGDAKPSFLLHSVGHWPSKSEINASIIYADYYYMEALIRYKKTYQQ
jgi:beta-xylosidase